MKKTNILMHDCSTRRERGFSLIELMISIAIGLMIIAGLVGVVTSNTQNSKTNDNTSELQENGRYALGHLQQKLRHADFRGYTWVAPNVSSVTVSNECLISGAIAGSFVNNLSQGVWGENDANPFSASCLTSGYVEGDVLVIREVGTAALTSPTPLIANNLYFRSTFAKGEMFKAVASQNATEGAPQNVDMTPFGVPLADFLVHQYVYYIGQGDCVGGGGSIPALCRLTLTGSTFVKELVVSGISQMQVEYARTPYLANTTQYFSANEITSDAAWEDVGAVRISLLAVNSKPEAGYTNSTNYSLGDWSNTYSDHYRRQVFRAVVQLRNFHEL